MTVAVSGDSITFNDNSVQATAPKVGMVNRIINGAMVIDQRNAGASVTINNTNTTYTIDRWAGQGQSTDGVFTVQRSSTAPTGFSNSMLVTVTTADASLGATQIYRIIHKIEGFNIADFSWGTANASSATLSFWFRSSVTGTFGGCINNSAANRNYPFTFTVNSANTFELKTIVVSGDTTGTWLTDNNIGLNLTFSLGMGSTFSGTAGAWSATEAYSATGATNLMATSGATFYITGVQLEKGSTATSFDYRPYGTELGLCQRYFQIEKGATTYAQVGTSAWNRSATTFVSNQKHTVPMRSIATGASLGAWYAGDSTLTNYQIGTISISFEGNSVYSTTINWSGVGAGASFLASGCCAPNAGPSITGGYSLSAEL